MGLNEEITNFLKDRGALQVGFTTKANLQGGPQSADLTYILPDAESAISFAIPLDKAAIRDYIAKTDYQSHVKNNLDVNKKCHLLALELAEWLKQRGFHANVAPPPGEYVKWANAGVPKGIGGILIRIVRKLLNSKRGKKIATRFYHHNSKFSFLRVEDTQYRMDVPNWREILPPYISHRYIAVQSGVAAYSWSGNVGLKGYGANIILASVVTNAKLIPTDPLPPSENFCDQCKICVSSCPTRMFEKEKAMTVTLGHENYTHSARKNLMRCQIACGGLSGLEINGKWSTWSPGRYLIPDNDQDMRFTLTRAYINHHFWPPRIGPMCEDTLLLTCGFCQLVCFGNRKETAENYRILLNSGCAIQTQTGEIKILPNKEAEAAFNALPLKHRTNYQ